MTQTNMKKAIYWAMLALTVLTGCTGEEDLLFDQSAAERLNAASEKYSQLLSSSEGGWVIQYYPTNSDPNEDDEATYTTGTCYLWCAKFNKDMMVTVGMKNYFSSDQYGEDASAWEIVTDNGPVLSFNSYNKCVHQFSDPDKHSIPNSSKNVWGVGVGGDYEFVIVDAPEDCSYVMLKGKKRATYNLMTPLPAGTDFKIYLAEVEAFTGKLFPASAPNEDVLTVGGVKYNFNSGSTGIIGMYPADGDAITETIKYPFGITKQGNGFHFRFRDKVTLNGQTVQDFVYDESRDVFVSTDNAECIMEGGVPFNQFVSIIDKKQRRWEWKETSDMSDSFSAKYQNMQNDFQTVLKNRLLNNCLRVNSNVLTYRLTYASGKQTVNIDYKFDMSRQGDTVTFQFVGDVSKVSTNARAMMPAVQEMIDLLQQPWTVTKAESNFNLSIIKLVSTADPNMWFVVSLV